MKIEKLNYLIIIPLFMLGSQIRELKLSDKLTFADKKENLGLKESFVFASNDLGITWQDISTGLPESKSGYNFINNGFGISIPTENSIYSYKKYNNNLIWEKEVLSAEVGNVIVCKSGIYGLKSQGLIVKKNKSNNTWEPAFKNFQKSNLRTIFETNSGAILIGCDDGLFKTTDEGATWKNVNNSGWVIKILEKEGTLIATSQAGIIRSVDDGDTWDTVISEGGVGIDVATIKNGFAAISYNTNSETRRVHTSYDSGKTWQVADSGLPPHNLTANIIQVGDFLFVGHPKGVFRSADKGKTWDLMLPNFGSKVFYITSVDNTIYLIPREGGC
jgi:hypothetical protein